MMEQACFTMGTERFGMRFDDCPLAMIVKMRIRSETRATKVHGAPRSTVHVCTMFWKRGEG